MADATAFFIDLVRAETRLYNALEERLRSDLAMTAGQFQLLEILDRRPECRVHDIVQELAITVGAVSKAIDRLVAAGWCRRVANPSDRRSSHLRLTPAGARQLSRARPVVDAEIAGHVKAIPRPDRRSTAAALATLRTHLEQVQGADLD